MAPRPDLPRSLRRAASRPAGPRGRVPSQALRDAAAAGLLTRSNTAPGTAGRRAADAASYRRRLAARPGVTAREGAGHVPAGTGEPGGSFFAEPVEGGGPRLLRTVKVSRADVHRLARYDAFVRQLTAGRMEAAAFERRIRGWRSIRVLGPSDVAGAYRFVAPPAAVLALAVEAAVDPPETWVDSGRARPLPRRRSPRPGFGESRGPRRRSNSGRHGRRGSQRQGETGPGLGELFDEVFEDIAEAVAEGADVLGEGLEDL